MTPAPALLALTVYACAWIAWTFPIWTACGVGVYLLLAVEAGRNL
jgi:hypothetical protein